MREAKPSARSSSPLMAPGASQGGGDRWSLTGWVSPSRSRVRFPAGRSRRRQRRRQGIRSSRTLPRLSDALLRHWRRAYGGGVQLRQLMYRGPHRAIAMRFVIRAATAVGVAAVWRVDRPRPSLIVH